MPRVRSVAVVVAVALLAAGCSSGRRAAPAPTTSAAVATTVTGLTTATVPTSTTTTAAAPATSASTTSPPALVWQPCGSGLQCATAHPPLDWEHPDGRTASLSVVRMPAAGPRSGRVGALFVNPGGPGASAVEFAKNARSYLPSAVRSRFDIIGVDPRGTAGSQPISCQDGPGLDSYFGVDPTPDDPAERQQLIDVNRQFADDCARRDGAILPYVDTRTAARDMDFVRAALGEPKLTYVGYSYGTFLGAMYADLFPTHLRAAVLDGAIDPTISAEQTGKEQAAGFEHAFDAFLADCANRSTCPLKDDGDPRAAYDRLSAAVESKPLAVRGRTVGPGQLYLAVVSALYSHNSWPTLASALHAGLAGDGGRLLAMADAFTERGADGSYGPLFSANAAVSCLDRPWPKDVAAYDSDAASLKAELPELGAAFAYGGLACAFWKTPPVDRERPLRAAGAPPILVVGTTGDPATPYAWAQSLATQLESGVLLTNVGDDHTAFGSAKPCVVNAVTAYIVNESVPAKGARCS